MKVRWPGTIKVYNNGSSQAKHTGFQDKPWGHGHGKKKKIRQVLQSVVFKHCDQLITFFRLKTYTRVQYTYSPAESWLSGFAQGLENIQMVIICGFPSNPDDCCFYSPDFLWCQRCRSGPGFPHLSETAVNILLHSAFQVSWELTPAVKIAML